MQQGGRLPKQGLHTQAVQPGGSIPRCGDRNGSSVHVRVHLTHVSGAGSPSTVLVVVSAGTMVGAATRRLRHTGQHITLQYTQHQSPAKSTTTAILCLSESGFDHKSHQTVKQVGATGDAASSWDVSARLLLLPCGGCQSQTLGNDTQANT
jgi:hypothetical protein